MPREVREELTRAGLPETAWKEVLTQTQPALALRLGPVLLPCPGQRPHPPGPGAPGRGAPGGAQIDSPTPGRVVRVERRGQDRLDFIQAVTVRTEDDHEYTLLSRDLSTTGIRLVGTRRLLGHKVRVTIPQADDGAVCVFTVRILWTCAVGEDLFENGGMFLEAEAP